MLSVNNRTTIPLSSGKDYVGKPDKVLNYNIASISLYADTTTQIKVYESNDLSIYKSYDIQVEANIKFNQAITPRYQYVYFVVINNSQFNQTHLDFDVLYKTEFTLLENGKIPVSDIITHNLLDTRSSHSFDGVLDAGYNTTHINLSLSPVKVLTIYGNSSNATILSLMLSNDGSTWYKSQYSYTLASSGDFGFTIQCSASYVCMQSSQATTLSIVFEAS